MPGKVIIDCERMKHPHTGLYHFCSQLGKALVQLPLPSQSALAFYVPPGEKGFAGNNNSYELQQWWHKLYMPFTRGYQLWHGTYQGSNYYPKGRLKKMLTIHDLNFLYDDKKNTAKQKKYLDKIQKQIRRSDQLTVISAFTLQCIKDNLDLGDIPVKVIYNGRNIPPADAEFERPVFVPQDIPYLFSIGTVVRKKNFHTLPALLVGNDYRLVIAGIFQDEAYKEQLIAEAKKHGVANRLILPGSITENEKWGLMQHMKAFVFPSIAEGFGLPVVEAMSFGKPTILSTLTSLPEIGSDAAYYFQSFDPVDMQQTLINSLHHFEKHPQQSALIKNRAAVFNWSDAARQYLQLYEKLLA